MEYKRRRFEEAIESVTRAASRCRQHQGRGAQQLLQTYRRYVALNVRLPAILREQRTSQPPSRSGGQDLPYQTAFATSCSVLSQALLAEPKQVEGPRWCVTQPACVAALAGSQGLDADRLHEQDRVGWAPAALDWLRQDHEGGESLLATGQDRDSARFADVSARWQSDPTLLAFAAARHLPVASRGTASGPASGWL